MKIFWHFNFYSFHGKNKRIMASGKSGDPLEFDDPKGLLKTVLDQVK